MNRKKIKEEAIRRLELMFDNNFYIDNVYILAMHARFEFKCLWKIAFNEHLSINDILFIQ